MTLLESFVSVVQKNPEYLEESPKCVLHKSPTVIEMGMYIDVETSKKTMAGGYPVMLYFHLDEEYCEINCSHEIAVKYYENHNKREEKRGRVEFFNHLMERYERGDSLTENEKVIVAQYNYVRKEVRGKNVNYANILDIPRRLYQDDLDVFPLREAQEFVAKQVLQEIPKEYEEDPLKYIEDHIGELAYSRSSKEVVG
jgi:hypothetical protein